MFLQLSLLSLLLHGAGMASFSDGAEAERSFTIVNDTFYKDGVPFRIMGGSLHYFRVHPQYWEDRLLRAKALGLNVIQSYVPWNLHQPQPGLVNFEGMADLEAFLALADKLNLLVMLRIGPYICGEWDFGGFPAWLLAIQPPLILRTSDPSFLRLVDKWWGILLPKVFRFLYSEGGPIIMVQVENEYGSYGNDTLYLQHLVVGVKFHLGDGVILYTTDGAESINLERGSLPGAGILAAVDFPTGWNASSAFSLQRLFNAPGKSPPISTEFYTGWLTHWGEPLAHTNATFTANSLEQLLQANGSFVLYMVHGGTNFGFSSGANTGSNATDYQPDITSYDYDAPIGEAGDVSAKFQALKAVILKYTSMSLPEPPPLPDRRAYGTLELQEVSSLFNFLERACMPLNAVCMDHPLPMEMINQVSGFILYRSTLPVHVKPGSTLSILEVRDRAQVFVQEFLDEGQGNALSAIIHVGTLYRGSSPTLQLPAVAAVPGFQIDILVENMGRVNYGPSLYDPKGITNSVLLDGLPIVGWTAFSISLETSSAITSCGFLDPNTPMAITRLFTLFRGHSEKKFEGPTFYQGRLKIDKPADTFLSLKGWSKGVAFINGFNLGRFWPSRGPQCTLYIPRPLLTIGNNEVMLLELETFPEMPLVKFVDTPDFSCGGDLLVA